jgi:pyruvate ferredoxin oxidoreductase beta subunit/oxalate oxidoreductase subunit beta
MAQIPTQQLEMVKNLRGIDQKEYYVPGHRTCAGCGPALCYKLVAKAAGPDSIFLGPTGCMYVANCSYMCTPFAMPWTHCQITNGGAVASGIEAAYNVMIRKGKYKGKLPNIVVMAGDGARDMGPGDVRHDVSRPRRPLRRRQRVVRQHRDPDFPDDAVRREDDLHPSGEDRPGREETLPQGCPAAGHRRAPGRALRRDRVGRLPGRPDQQGPQGPQLPGPVLPAHPLPVGWLYDCKDTVKVAKQAVETGMWTNYEWENANTLSAIPKTYKPVKEYLKNQERFSHLNEEHIAKMQAFITAKTKAPGKPIEVPVLGPREQA